jgi:hypothetical protein
MFEQYLVCLFSKSLHSKKYKNKHVIAHIKCFNYWFWMNDAIHRCILLEEFNFNKKSTLLLP